MSEADDQLEGATTSSPNAKAASQLARPYWRREVTSREVSILFVVAGLMAFAAVFLNPHDQELLDLEQQVKRVELATTFHRSTSSRFQDIATFLPKSLGFDKLAAIVVLKSTLDGQTTASNACVVSQRGSILALADHVGPLGTTSTAVFAACRCASAHSTTCTVLWRSSRNNLALLVPEEPPIQSIVWLDPVSSASTEFGGLVTITALTDYLTTSPIPSVAPATSHHAEFHPTLSAEVGSWLLLDHAVGPDMLGAAVTDANRRLIGLVSFRRPPPDPLGEPVCLATPWLVDLPSLIAAAETSATLARAMAHVHPSTSPTLKNNPLPHR